MDRDLEDQWLERLNYLEAFSLISICEGHPDQRPGASRKHPHVNLRLRTPLADTAASRWFQLREALGKALHLACPDSTARAELDLRLSLRAGQCRSEPRSDVTVRFIAAQERRTPSMDEATRCWFASVVDSIIQFDRTVLDLLSSREAVR